MTSKRFFLLHYSTSTHQNQKSPIKGAFQYPYCTFIKRLQHQSFQNRSTSRGAKHFVFHLYENASGVVVYIVLVGDFYAVGLFD